MFMSHAGRSDAKSMRDKYKIESNVSGMVLSQLHARAQSAGQNLIEEPEAQSQKMLKFQKFDSKEGSQSNLLGYDLVKSTYLAVEPQINEREGNLTVKARPYRSALLQSYSAVRRHTKDFSINNQPSMLGLDRINQPSSIESSSIDKTQRRQSVEIDTK